MNPIDLLLERVLLSRLNHALETKQNIEQARKALRDFYVPRGLA